METERTPHTPTPWDASNWRICANVRGPRAIKVICDTANNKATRTDENAANAAFIVKACNSHDALLEACLAAIMATGGSKFWNGETHDFLVKCEAAIVKAAGESVLKETLRAALQSVGET